MWTVALRPSLRPSTSQRGRRCRNCTLRANAPPTPHIWGSQGSGTSKKKKSSCGSGEGGYCPPIHYLVLATGSPAGDRTRRPRPASPPSHWGDRGGAPPLTPPTGGTPLYSCFPDFGLANRGAVSEERPVAVPSSLFASRFSIFSPHRRSAIARGLEVFHPALPRCLHHQFLPSLYADKWLSAIPLAHCLRELTGEIRCLGGAFPVSAPPVAYLGLLGSVSLPSQLYSRARRFMPDASGVQPLAADRT